MKKDLIDKIELMQGQSVLVIGDMVADVYLYGNISRISREAPVLVLEQAEEKIIAGGAANVANNAATLGGRVLAVGLVGLDNGARGLKEVLGKNGVDTTGFFCDEKRPTITKTRVIAGGRATVSQQVVRIDKETKVPMAPAFEANLMQYLKQILPNVNGVVLSDYGSGTITEEIKELLLTYCRENGVPTIIDSRYDIHRFKGIDYVKQNDAELAAAVGYELTSEELLYKAGTQLLAEMQAKGVLITRGEKGMTLFEEDGSVHDIPVSDKSEVYDVSGAGDTCVAAVILSLAAGVEPIYAAEISNYASGIAVRKLGTATVSTAELARVIKNEALPC
jgi:rfaE bifunctional protein kinase chain/domain